MGSFNGYAITAVLPLRSGFLNIGFLCGSAARDILVYLVEDLEGLGKRGGAGEHHHSLSPLRHVQAHFHLLGLLALLTHLNNPRDGLWKQGVKR